MRKFFLAILISMIAFMGQGCSMFSSGTSSAGADESIDTTVKKEARELSENKQLEFESRFFEALKNRHIGNSEKAIRLLQRCQQLQPTDPTVYHELSKVYKSEGNLKKALTYAKESVEYGEDQYWYLKNLSSIYRKRQDYQEAAATMEEIIRKHEGSPQFYFQLANVYLRQQKMEKALEVYDRFEEQFGKDPQITKQKKRIYLRQNKVEKAAGVIRDLIEDNPQNLKHYKQLAQIYEANEKREKALEVYKEMLEVKPGNAGAQMAIAGYYVKQGNQEKGLRYLKKAFGNADLAVDEKVKFMLSQYLDQQGTSPDRKNEAFKLGRLIVETHPESAKSHALYGDLLFRDDQQEKARAQYKKSLKYKKDNFSVWQNLIRINYELKDFKALRKSTNKAMTYFPNQPIVYFYNGMAKKELGDLKKAIDQFEAGLNLNVNNANLETQFYSNLAMTYHDLENYPESDKYFDKALEMNPNDPYILNNYAWYLALRGDKLDKAQKMSSKSLELQPENSAYLDTYGWIQYKKDNFKDAKEYVGRALEKNPEDPELLEHYGDILFKLGNKQKALKHWKQAKDNGGDSQNLEEKIAQKSIQD